MDSKTLSLFQLSLELASLLPKAPLRGVPCSWGGLNESGLKHLSNARYRCTSNVPRECPIDNSVTSWGVLMRAIKNRPARTPVSGLGRSILYSIRPTSSTSPQPSKETSNYQDEKARKNSSRRLPRWVVRPTGKHMHKGDSGHPDRQNDVLGCHSQG